MRPVRPLVKQPAPEASEISRSQKQLLPLPPQPSSQVVGETTPFTFCSLPGSPGGAALLAPASEAHEAACPSPAAGPAPLPPNADSPGRSFAPHTESQEGSSQRVAAGLFSTYVQAPAFLRKTDIDPRRRRLLPPTQLVPSSNTLPSPVTARAAGTCSFLSATAGQNPSQAP